MKVFFKFLAVVVPFAVVLSAGADETFPTLEANGKVFRNITVTMVTATDIYFTYDGGMGNVKIKDLSPELQGEFNYNPTAAAAQEKKQALANAQFVGVQWGRDLPAALNQAHAENKQVLLDFTGSDWCGSCMELDQEVFSTPRFKSYAVNKLALVRVDFPHHTLLSDDLRQANAALGRRFGVNAYPTCILLDSSGTELGREVGCPEGGPDVFTAELDSFNTGFSSVMRFARYLYWLVAIPPCLVPLHLAARALSTLLTRIRAAKPSATTHDLPGREKLILE
jgi:protein disulfide-isomerase